jgi:hypothetical protein
MSSLQVAAKQLQFRALHIRENLGPPLLTLGLADHIVGPNVGYAYNQCIP